MANDLSAQQECRICKVKKPMSAFYKSPRWINGCGRISTCKDCDKVRKRDYLLRIRREVLSHYGSKCACCGVEFVEFLEIDHVNSDGCDHRRSARINLYVYLIKNKYPSSFQLLCSNCNLSFARYGYCPHNPLVTRSRFNGKKVEGVPSLTI